MNITSVSALVESLQESQLLTPSQGDELSMLPSQFSDPEELLREVVRRDWLTSFQLDQVKAGRAADLLLGSYAVLEPLGEGGMGQVFKARHRVMGRLVALKTIRKERLANDQSIRRFYREVQAVSRLAHPNIVIAFDAAQAEGTHFFAMEFVNGTDLGRLVKNRGPLAIEQACECIRQAACGLQHAHQHGMVHRDIKPHNLMLGVDGTLKILDMGLARVHALAEGETDGSLTEAGSIMGTPDYIAPEQAMSSHSVDIRADIYSLGCTFYFLLTGQPVFPGGRPLEKLIKHQQEEPRLVESLRPDVPPAVAGILRRMMAKNPDERYQTPGEVADALANQGGSVAQIATPAPGDEAGYTSRTDWGWSPSPKSASANKKDGLGNPSYKSPSSSDATQQSLKDQAKATEFYDAPRARTTRRWLLAAALAGVALLAVLFFLAILPSLLRDKKDANPSLAEGKKQQDKQGQPPDPEPKRPEVAPKKEVPAVVVGPGPLPPPGAVRVLVDASKDGGVWWSPQGKDGFDANKPRQGGKLAAYLKSLGYTVRELPRDMGDMSAELKGANFVIRAGDYRPHTPAEVEAYKTYVQEGGNLLLLAGYRDFVSKPDPLAEGFGIRFAKSVRKSQIDRWGSHPAVSDLPPTRFGVGSVVAKSPASAIPLAWLGKNEDLSIAGDALVLGMTDFGKGRVLFLSSQLFLQEVPQPLTQRLLTLLAVDAPQTPASSMASVQPGQYLELAGPTLQGDPFDLKKLQGKVVLIDFWATWCRPCVAEMPNVLRVYQRYHKDGLEVVGVNMDNSRPALMRFLKGKDLPWPQIFFNEPDKSGWQNPLAQRYGVRGIPFTILIDRTGKVTQVDLRDRGLELAVAKMLGRQPASPEEMERELEQIIRTKFVRGEGQ